MLMIVLENKWNLPKFWFSEKRIHFYFYEVYLNNVSKITLKDVKKEWKKQVIYAVQKEGLFINESVKSDNDRY